LRVAIALDDDGRVARIGLAAQACAIGQASAAIMAAQAIGRDQQAFADAEAAIVRWLAGDSVVPAWPGISAIAAARDYKGRHGAILLGWRAVLAAFAGQFGA